MADTLLELQFGELPEGYCYPATPQDLNEAIMNYGHAVFPGTLTSFNFGDSEPAVADRDKPWIRTVSGDYDGVYVWSGTANAWIAPVKPYSAYERKMFIGTENQVWAYDGGDGTDPGASPPTTYTGAMWEVDTNFAFKFPLGVGTNGTTYDGNPASSVAVTGTGGAERVQLTTDELAAHTHDIITDLADNNQDDTTPPAGSDGVNTHSVVWTHTSESTGGDKYHQNMPPYYGVYFIKRTARMYYTV